MNWELKEGRISVGLLPFILALVDPKRLVVHCLAGVQTGRTAETELAPETRISSRLSGATRSLAPSADPVEPLQKQSF